jgi:hypothetical protein
VVEAEVWALASVVDEVVVVVVDEVLVEVVVEVEALVPVLVVSFPHHKRELRMEMT